MSAPQNTSSHEKYAYSMMNLALLDPQRYGWPAVGPVTDLLTPHERARRKASKRAAKSSKKRKRGRPIVKNSNNNTANASLKPPPPPPQASLENNDPQNGAAAAQAGPNNAADATNKANSLPAEAVDYMKAWLMSPEHIAHPYPTDQEKAEIMAKTGIGPTQLTNWFVNNRKRYWKPRVEANAPDEFQSATEKAQSATERKEGDVPTTSAESLTEDAKEPPSKKSKTAAEDGEKDNQQDKAVGEAETSEAQPAANGGTATDQNNIAVESPEKDEAATDTPKTTESKPKDDKSQTDNAKSHTETMDVPMPVPAIDGSATFQLEQDNPVSEPTPNGTESLPESMQDKSAAAQPTQGETALLATSGDPVVPSTSFGQDNPAATETAAQPQASQINAEEKQQGPETNDKVVRTSGVRFDKSLDIYAYHRGREGMEPRDATTGELLCDVEPSDTNYRLDEPKLNLSVTVKFPLIDEFDLKQAKPSDVPMFEDSIPWNLGDPETPTPMDFAIDTAEGFGLSFNQTTDLATSIQEQIYRHVREHCGYAEPVALTDGAGTERTNFPPYTVPRLYGEVFENEATPPGTFYATVAAPSSKGRSRAALRAPLLGSQGTNSRRGSLSENSGGRSSRPPPALYEEDEDPLEDLYIEEVKRRLVEISKADVLAKANTQPGPLGSIQLKQNFVCHICHKRNELAGLFACGNPTHSYCGNHLRVRLGLDVHTHSDEVTFDHCPICSVTCSCSKCLRRIKALGRVLKKLSKEQGVEARSTVFDNIRNCYLKPISFTGTRVGGAKRRDSNGSSATEASRMSSELSKQKPPAKTKSGRKWGDEKQVKVKKVAAKEFPREIRNAKDLDPGNLDDYLTVYTVDGSYKKDPATIPLPSKPKVSDDPSVVAEDGNVEYCQKCRQPGDLFCCDFCPRAFHRDCLEGDPPKDGSDDPWECHRCIQERVGLPEYTLTGANSEAAISMAYSTLKSTCDDDLTQLSTLSKMREMVEKLVNSDFGYMFREPVDCGEIPGYTKIIKQPMDLQTITTRLEEGYYSKFFEENRSWAEVHQEVLKDIELVWHNCFTFNFEGSAVHRMATVMRRLTEGMKRRSLNKDLHKTVKENVETFVRTRARERGKFASRKVDHRPVSKHRILVKGRGGISRKIAILDPETGMVVKIYTTVRNASMAAEFMAGTRGHKTEFPLVNYHAILGLVDRSTQDPTATLFGYRWLDYETLCDEQVAFSPSGGSRPVVIEMIDGESIFIFLSVDEALSCPRLPTDVSTDKVFKNTLRKVLQELPEAGEGYSDSGLHWRRHKRLGSNTSTTDKDVALSPFWTGNAEQNPENQCNYLPERVIIVKEDVALRRTLAGFETQDAAFGDWEAACKASPTFLSEEITRDSFDTYYVDGERNVDGIVWKTADKNTLRVSSQDLDATTQPTQPKEALSIETDAKEAHGDARLVLADSGPTTSDTVQTSAHIQNDDSADNILAAETDLQKASDTGNVADPVTI